MPHNLEVNRTNYKLTRELFARYRTVGIGCTMGMVSMAGILSHPDSIIQATQFSSFTN